MIKSKKEHLSGRTEPPCLAGQGGGEISQTIEGGGKIACTYVATGGGVTLDVDIEGDSFVKEV